MNKLLLVFILIIAVLVSGAVAFTIYKSFQPEVLIKNQTFRVAIVKTDKDKQIGLSKYKSLAMDHGMLFIFDKAALYPFWMKNMRFPIDIIFIRDNKIVTIYQNLPINNLTIYSPTASSNRVLEINAGLSKKYGFSTGDTVAFKNIK